ncbi:MAG TPA: DUF1102 domain-containing protein [Candidatus Thermoplasmatota archaeon]|nr:DUF1102 domain-containing protein [Candidatus Thermoplasmatota archaeon]
MRTSFQTFALVTLAAASVFAASAFNWATLDPRAVVANVVSDTDAYISIETVDTEYDCYVAYTNGRVDITWDGGTSCEGAAGGTGVNKDAQYYFHDVIKITNKGTKTLSHLWLNMTDTVITINIATAANTMTTDDSPGYEQRKDITNLAPGGVRYIGFKIDSTGVNAGTAISKTMDIEARSSA